MQGHFVDAWNGDSYADQFGDCRNVNINGSFKKITIYHIDFYKKIQ